ncbi:hypothetical protein HDU67_009012 [Dinochytrium kinnereticum]|nr:hypothetical protein HDU67_009012 [Dinochytrium kinnereticum]
MGRKKRDVSESSGSSDSGDDDGRSKRRRTDKKRDASPDKHADRKKKRSSSSKADKKKDKERKHRKNDDSGDSSGSESDTSAMMKARKGQPRIAVDDYFNKSTEYIVWLKEAKDKYLDDLDAKASRKYFKKFVKKWNRYLSTSHLDELPGAEWRWFVAGNDEEADKLDDLKASIGRLTKSGDEFLRGKPRRTVGPSAPPPSIPQRPQSSRPAPPGEDMDEEDLQRYNRLMDKKDRKSHQKTHEAIVEELVPKPTGRDARDAMIDKRKQQTAYHKQERDIDVELPEAELLGGSDSFAAA